MQRFNSDKNVSMVELSGNIPFMSKSEISLVFVDTPGPNYARDKSHEEIQRKFLHDSSKALVIYVLTGQFGTTDDNALLERVSKSMAVGGKQSKDRFIFVINKLDELQGGNKNDDINGILDDVRAYLRRHAITNPNLFPAAALPALNIRLCQNRNRLDLDVLGLNEDDLEEIQDEADFVVKKLNRNENFHFESFAELSPNLSTEIKEQLETTRSQWMATGKPVNSNPDEALIHTGVKSIELAIRQYIEKYAKTAKIKNIVNAFIHKIEEVDMVEKTKKEILRHQQDSVRILSQIGSIKDKMASGQEAQKFKNIVDDTIKRVDDESKKDIENIIQKFKTSVSSSLDKLRGKELEISQVYDEVEYLKILARNFEIDIKEDLEKHIEARLINISNSLFEDYKKKISLLADEIDISSIKIEPLKLMRGSFKPIQLDLSKVAYDKEVEAGQEFVINYNKAWYKPWTWGESEGHYVTRYKTLKIIHGAELADDFLNNVISAIEDNCQSAIKYAAEQSGKISESFNLEVKRLDEILRNKLLEFESYLTDHEMAEKRVKESEEKLKWLEFINAQVESILEI
jgi:hypothetical protein